MHRRGTAVLLVFGALVSIAAGRQPRSTPVQQPPRDVVPGRAEVRPQGTAIIRGRVVAADTGNPIPRATVNLSPVVPPRSPAAAERSLTTASSGAAAGSASRAASAVPGRPRQVSTDAQGAFEFTGLPAGSYRLLVSTSRYSPQYLGMAFGARRPGGPGGFDLGQPVQVSDGQTFDKALVALPKGGVVTGRVIDENGEPLVQMRVYTIFFLKGSRRGIRVGSGSETDDLGQFRLYGLQPGDHAVVAETQRMYVGPPDALEPNADRFSFLTTYYPGTPDESFAQRVRAGVGTETPGVDIRMQLGRLYRVSGTVVDSRGQPLANPNGSMARRTPMSQGTSNFGFGTDGKGQFRMHGVPAGDYKVTVMQSLPPGKSNPDEDAGERASVALTVADADVDGLLVMTTPGVTITGRLLFEQGAAPAVTKERRIIVVPGDPESMHPLPFNRPVVRPDSTFTVTGLFGELLLRAYAPNQHPLTPEAGGGVSRS